MSEARVARFPFNKEDADVVLLTSDGVHFRTYRNVLSLSSPSFEAMFSLTTADRTIANVHEIPVAEDSLTIEHLLRLCYPTANPKITSVADAKKVLEAARKYQMAEAIRVMEAHLLDPRPASKAISQTSLVPASSLGIADIVGFGPQGVVILRNSISIQSIKVINQFGCDAGKWSTERHVRLIADTTGDKQADIVGFGDEGVLISVNNGNNTFVDPPKMVLSGFSYVNGGWRVDRHIRFMADVRNVGRSDIVGFGDAGVLISRNNGGGNFSSPELAVADFGYVRGGWRLDKHLRFLADVSGDGLLDIVGFGESKVFIGRNNGDGTFQPAQSVISGIFCYNGGGWHIEKHPRFVADLTGDGRPDIIGFGDAGVYVSLNNGSGVFEPSKLVLATFGYDAGGWRVEKHPRFIASLTEGKHGDIVGFGDDGVVIAINNGNGTFQTPKRVIDSFGYNQGWRVEKHPRFVVDLTGNGCADIIGFGESSVWVSYNSGGGNFGPATKLTDDFSYSGGWRLENTVRYVVSLYH